MPGKGLAQGLLFHSSRLLSHYHKIETLSHQVSSLPSPLSPPRELDKMPAGDREERPMSQSAVLVPVNFQGSWQGGGEGMVEDGIAFENY